MKTFVVFLFALVAVCVLADDAPQNFNWEITFSGPDCDWSNALRMTAVPIPTCGTGSNPCSNSDTEQGKLSSLIFCGPDVPAGKDSPAGSWVVSYASGGNCQGTVSKKLWYADDRCVPTPEQGASSEKRTCSGNQIQRAFYDGYVCDGAAAHTSQLSLGCDSDGGGKTSASYSCGLKASPASTLVASSVFVVLALALAL